MISLRLFLFLPCVQCLALFRRTQVQEFLVLLQGVVNVKTDADGVEQ